MLSVIADQVEVVPGLPAHQRAANERPGAGHPHHLVVVQLARRSPHCEPAEPQLVAGLLLGEVVHLERPSPKSRVAIVVVVGCASSSSVQPVRLNGLMSGAVNRVARTETDPRPAESRPRISATA